jgi:hypothetical protein
MHPDDASAYRFLIHRRFNDRTQLRQLSEVPIFDDLITGQGGSLKPHANFDVSHRSSSNKDLVRRGSVALRYRRSHHASASKMSALPKIGRSRIAE